MKFKRHFKMESKVDLIPMIDIVFQLILFFLVSTTFAVLPGISLTLPESGTSEPGDMSGIVITVTADESVWVNSDKVPLSKIDVILQRYPLDIEKRSTVPVCLEADEQVRNGTIVKIFDALRSTGFASVNLRTTEK